MTQYLELARLLAPPAAPARCKACGNAALGRVGAVDFNRVELSPPPFPPAGIAVDYWQCAACGFAWAPAFDGWSAADLSRHIYNAGIERTEQPEFAAQRAANVAAMLRPWLAGSPPVTRVLDYGCGPGLLVGLLRRDGIDACGYDPFRSDFAARPAGRYDIVACFEVLEHVQDVAATADELAGFLAPRGVLVIGTYLAARPLDTGWWYCSPRGGHICFWTHAALSAVFNRRGLNVACDGRLFSIVYPDAARERVMKIIGQP